MSYYIIKVFDDGEVYGYTPLEAFAKEHGVTAHALRKEIERGHIKTLTVGKGPAPCFKSPLMAMFKAWVVFMVKITFSG